MKSRVIESVSSWQAPLPRAIYLLAALALVLTQLLPSIAVAAPGQPAGNASADGLHGVLARHLPASQTSTDDDELRDLVVVPIDSSLKPDAVLRSRPFVLGARSERAFPYNLRQPQPLTEDEARNRLKEFLTRRDVDVEAIDDALARFDQRRVKRIIPDPALRAAVLMLTDWDPYEATLRAILDGENPSGRPYREVIFDDIGFPGAIATLYENPRDGRASLVVSEEYAGEDPAQLIPVIVHESLHGGGYNSAEEEIIANILDTICYAEVLLVEPRVAYLRTDLTVFNNLELLALLNSMGRGGPGQLGVATSPLGDIFVGPEFARYDFESIRYVVESDDFYDALGNHGSPGQQTTAALISRFPGGKSLGSEPEYNEEMIAVIDRGIGKVISPAKAVRLARTLGLYMTESVQEVEAQGRVTARLALDQRPFLPRDAKNYFDLRRAKRTGKALTEDEGRSALAEMLERRQVEPATAQDFLAAYDDPATAALIPDPSLRAATLMLAAWEPWNLALDVIFRGVNPEGVPLRVEFADLRHSAPAARRSGSADGASQPAILINSLLYGESPEVLAAAIVEGTLLHDDTWTKHEAIAAALMGTLAYADIVLAEPSVAKGRTWGVMTRNRDLLALLNSAAWPGDPAMLANADSIGFLAAPNGAPDVLLGLYADATSFADYILTLPHAARFDRYSVLEAPDVFEHYLAFANISPERRFRGLLLFDEATLSAIDASLGAFVTPEEALSLAKSLRLGVLAAE
ncbi:MAG TPA: hypothetical protein VIL01_09375 [Thermomicrobiales bacterium]